MDSPFYAQLHLHTAESSRCGRVPAKQMVRRCKELGYSLIVITDHFFNANINCDPWLSWPEKVDCLMKGYRLAKEEGDKLGLTVLFGWETCTGGPEILTYGLDENYLLAHPDVADWPLEKYLSRMAEAGAFCCHAHPYRQAYYIPTFKPRAELFEALEVFNNCHEGNRHWDDKALSLARRHGCIQLAGSDAHNLERLEGGAMALPWPVQDMPGLIEALRSRKAKVVEKL